MIYTVTFNPAIDYIIDTDENTVGNVVRTTRETIVPGGKGINVSIVLKRLGIENTALGFVAGFTGNEIETLLAKEGVKTDFVHLDDGYSRINVKLKGNTETEINAKGPHIPNHSLEELLAKLDSLSDGDFLVLAGSVPKGVSSDIYCTILDTLSHKNLKIILDAEGELITKALRFNPFLIKPNNHELGAIFSKKLNTPKEIAKYANLLRKEGAKNVLVSMAGDGALLATENGEFLHLPTPNGSLKNSTGAGDSSVAGFISGYLNNGDYATALLTAVCSGSATAFSDNLATTDEISELIKAMKEIKPTHIQF
ncbi:MAG: 1-phosphofructokinase [Clostridia bacterium]|nr:1-phosphofructokinase [Clostridia bacterium]